MGGWSVRDVRASYVEQRGFSPRERVAPAALPMDLISDQLDINGLLLNPEWQYQATNHEYPDVPKLCNVYDYHLAGWTTQYVTSNTQPNTGWNAGCNWPDVSSTFTSGLFCWAQELVSGDRDGGRHARLRVRRFVVGAAGHRLGRRYGLLRAAIRRKGTHTSKRCRKALADRRRMGRLRSVLRWRRFSLLVEPIL